jgi:hypothetical protein
VSGLRVCEWVIDRAERPARRHAAGLFNGVRRCMDLVATLKPPGRLPTLRSWSSDSCATSSRSSSLAA